VVAPPHPTAAHAVPLAVGFLAGTIRRRDPYAEGVLALGLLDLRAVCHDGPTAAHRLVRARDVVPHPHRRAHGLQAPAGPVHEGQQVSEFAHTAIIPRRGTP